jgi:acetyltransferase-like isoleucine patch superfamily enzyme
LSLAPSTDSGGRPWPLRLLRRAAVRVRDLLWALRIRWLRVRGADAASRALLTAQTALALRILRAFGAQIGEGATLRPPLHLMNVHRGFSNLRVGEQAWLGPDVLLDLAAPLHIGERATLSARSSLVTHLDVGASRLREVYPHAAAPVSIGADAYLGTGVTVLHGVEIGAGTLVAAGAVVRTSLPPGVVAAGVPACVVKRVSESSGPAGPRDRT